MSKHTPGPWTIVPYGNGDSLVIHADQSEWRICFMATPGQSPGAMDRIEANARLIAVAPEMLELLKRLDNSLESLGREFRLQIRDAIAKAEGK